MKPKVKVINGVGKFLVDLLVCLLSPSICNNWRAFATFWGTIYVRNESDLKNKKVFLHENQHLKQIAREGVIKFSIKYVYYNMKYGYYNNPYEVEAREIARH